mmetsp:Transcript_92426/g.298752  ORF Transcript_92426/g.298752 Transcript_92426/m.298752 type:complete len:231 (-) Transcript_92426:558-1250(-)
MVHPTGWHASPIPECIALLDGEGERVRNAGKESACAVTSIKGSHVAPGRSAVPAKLRSTLWERWYEMGAERELHIRQHTIFAKGKIGHQTCSNIKAPLGQQRAEAQEHRFVEGGVHGISNVVWSSVARLALRHQSHFHRRSRRHSDGPHRMCIPQAADDGPQREHGMLHLTSIHGQVTKPGVYCERRGVLRNTQAALSGLRDLRHARQNTAPSRDAASGTADNGNDHPQM